jgi:hypothetical protein
MWFLRIFGDNVEERLGLFLFPIFYLSAGVMGGLAQYIVDPNSTIPMLGASGAIAGVLVIEAITRTAGDNLFDLTALIAIFTGITILISTLRSRKYSQVTYRTTQTLDEFAHLVETSHQNFWTRLEEAPYRARIRAINSLRESLPRFLIIREGELAHRTSKKVYGFAPLLGLMAGVFVSVQVFQAGGFAKLAVTTILFLLLL